MSSKLFCDTVVLRADTIAVHTTPGAFRTTGEQKPFSHALLHCPELTDEEVFLLLRELTDDWDRMELTAPDEAAACRCLDLLNSRGSPLSDSMELKVYGEERFRYFEAKRKQGERLRRRLLLALLTLTAGLVAALTGISMTMFEKALLILTYSAAAVPLGVGAVLHFMNSPVGFTATRPFAIRKGESLL